MCFLNEKNSSKKLIIYQLFKIQNCLPVKLTGTIYYQKKSNNHSERDFILEP